MDLPTGPFSLLYADPPWRFKTYSKAGLGKSADNHYTTMSIDEMRTLPVVDIAADNSLLVMWVYDPMLLEAISLAASWGFYNLTTVEFRWLKGNHQRLHFGLGYHTRGGGCEECWLFKRGKGLPVLSHKIRKEFYAERREHSRKPDEVRGWLVDLYGDVPRIELFARTSAPGWVSWGLENEKYQA